MSVFTGKLKEYSSISVDCFDKNNMESSLYFLSHCHQDHMKGLDSSAFHQRLMRRGIPCLYCSETSMNILLCNNRYRHLKKFLVGLAIESPAVLTMRNKETGIDESLTVTLLSAGHCIGSVMFLFEGNGGRVIYTGDFRWNVGDVRRVPYLHFNHRVKDITSVYVDTTFYLHQMNRIPSRESTRDAVLRLVKRWLSRGPNYFVSLLCEGMYGYEYLLKEIALSLNTKIHVSAERLSLYENLTDMSKHFTCDMAENTRIHSCHWEEERNVDSQLPCGYSLASSQKMKVLKIKASSMWFARRTQPIPSDCVVEVNEDFYRVIHSMHASMEEIVDLVKYLQPINIFPTVEPAGLFSLKETEKSLRQYTRSNEDDVSEASESSRSSLYREPNHVFKRTKSFLFHESVPDEQVLSECRRLGIEEDVLMAPPCRRRRRTTKK